MIDKILHPEIKVVCRNLKAYNLLHNTDYTLDNLNILVHRDKVFHLFREVSENYVFNQEYITTAHNIVELIISKFKASTIKTVNNTIHWYEDEELLISYYIVEDYARIAWALMKDAIIIHNYKPIEMELIVVTIVKQMYKW